MGATYDDLEGHEGYGVGRPGAGTASEVVVAVCRCGWVGGIHPPTKDGHDELIDDWDRHHARPLLATTLPLAVADLVAEARRAVAATMDERPRAVLAAVEDLAAWADDVAARARRAVGSPTRPADPARRRTGGRRGRTVRLRTRGRSTRTARAGRANGWCRELGAGGAGEVRAAGRRTAALDREM